MRSEVLELRTRLLAGAGESVTRGERRRRERGGLGARRRRSPPPPIDGATTRSRFPDAIPAIVKSAGLWFSDRVFNRLEKHEPKGRLIQLKVKTLLNRIQHFAGFVYDDIRLEGEGGAQRIEVSVSAHAGIKARCSCCRKPAPGYDTPPRRQWLFVPLWAIAVCFLYAPRRVNCPDHGVVVEHIPWSAGKRPVCTAMMVFPARWARRLSWRETSRMSHTSWEAVYRSVEWFAEWGPANRKLQGVESIGVDEIHWGKGLKSANFLTVIYQIDKHCRRLLWVGPKRAQQTLRKGLDAPGSEVVGGIKFVCTDMWQPHLAVIKAGVAHALHVLDRFHITSHLNQAVDKVRRGESARLRGRPQAAKLKHMRWRLPRKSTRARGKARIKLNALAGGKLATARAWTLKESFTQFWKYKCVHWAGGFLDVWTPMAMRSRLEPMKKVARMLRSHEELLLNWFRARGELSSAAVEGQNNKIRVVTRGSYGFRTYHVMELALYHNLGKLPEPDCGFTHTFC